MNRLFSRNPWALAVLALAGLSAVVTVVSQQHLTLVDCKQLTAGQTLLLMSHNALFYVVRYTFLVWVTLTPFGIWFLRAMGMKIGRHAFVNTDLISDPRLITLGADVASAGACASSPTTAAGGTSSSPPSLSRTARRSASARRSWGTCGS